MVKRWSKTLDVTYQPITLSPEMFERHGGRSGSAAFMVHDSFLALGQLAMYHTLLGAGALLR
jgi:hypothetical protein